MSKKHVVCVFDRLFVLSEGEVWIGIQKLAVCTIGCEFLNLCVKIWENGQLFPAIVSKQLEKL